MTGVILAVEDILGEVVCRKLLEQEGILVQQAVGLCGNTFLRAKALNFNRVSLRVPVVMLTDLDDSDLCPADFVRSWLQGAELAPRFFLRVAVREVESWVMAHRSAFANFMGVSQAIIPRDTDSIPDPKAYVVQLGRRSRKREIQRALVPVARSTAAVGPGYNRELTSFVREHWQTTEARRASPSLNRSVVRLRELSQ